MLFFPSGCSQLSVQELCRLLRQDLLVVQMLGQVLSVLGGSTSLPCALGVLLSCCSELFSVPGEGHWAVG